MPQICKMGTKLILLQKRKNQCFLLFALWVLRLQMPRNQLCPHDRLFTDRLATAEQGSLLQSESMLSKDFESMQV